MKLLLGLCAALAAAGCDDGFSNTPLVDMARLPADLSVDAGPNRHLCDVPTQSGCPAGSHCTVGTLDDLGADVCVPDQTPPIPRNGDCTKVPESDGMTGDNCAAGDVCTKLAQQQKCRQVCAKHSDCAAGFSCVGITDSPSFITTCIPEDHCDPVAQTGCTAGLSCYFSALGNDDLRATLCLQPNGKNLPVGGDCTTSLDCAAGETCAGLGFCRHFCYLQGAVDGGAGSCPAEEGECSYWSGSGATYGRCE